MEYRFFRLTIALILGGFLLPATLIGQITNLSGTINTYIDVTAVNTTNNTVTIPSITGLAKGDTVFLIQMQGATIDANDAATFGNVSNMNSAGKYEFNIICKIDTPSTTITLQRYVNATYDPAMGLQMIPVVNYRRVNVAGNITAPAWNGNLGGVIVIAAPNSWVRLSANIDASSKGFRGGVRQDMVSGCTCANYATQYTSYFYATGAWQGALKGEGVSPLIGGKEAGKGKQANGGGGGNDHNTGGAGGANFGTGGNGGLANASSCFFGSYCRGLHAGIGGLGLSTTYYSNIQNRLFMGGGGGAGHYGNASVGGGSAGGNGEVGGGIVVIWTDSINGNGFSITANGNNIIPTSAADGGGGGGAGGVIVLDARAFSSNPITVTALGGNGANHTWGGAANNCKGTGGGGGGGVVWFRGAANPPTISSNVSGGLAGIQGGASCSALGNNGATAGANGSVLTSFSRMFPSVTIPPCLLPVEFAYFQADKLGTSAVQLLWETTTEIGNSRFEIQRSADADRYETIGRVASTSRNQQGAAYTWNDNAPMTGTNWYRLRQIDQNGTSTVTEAVAIQFQGKQMIAISALYPNPVAAPAEAILELISPVNSTAVVAICDIVGKTIYQVSLPMEIGANSYRLPTENMSPGIYFLKVNAGIYGELVHKLRVN